MSAGDPSSERGFNIKKGISHAARVSDFNLSARAEHALEQMGIQYVYQLKHINPCDFLECRACGRKTVQEIAEVFYQKQTALQEAEAVQQPEALQDGQFLPSPANEYEWETPIDFVDALLIDLSVRARHALIRLRIRSVKQLLALGEAELWNTTAVGRKTVSEILDLQRVIRERSQSSPVVLDPNMVADRRAVNMAAFSKRAQHVLQSHNIRTEGELLRWNIQQSCPAYSCGAKTRAEIESVRSAIRKRRAGTNKLPGTRNELQESLKGIKQMATKYDLPFEELRQEFHKLRKESPDSIPKVNPFAFRLVRDKILDILKEIIQTAFDGIAPEELIAQLPETEGLPQEAIDQLLDELVRRGSAYRDDSTHLYHPCLASIFDYVATIPQKTQREILEKRLQGMKLEEIGQAFHVTRERVRQICAKWLDKRPKIVREDRYREDFLSRKWSEHSFCACFHEPPRVFCYLQLVYRLPENHRTLLGSIKFADEQDRFVQYLQTERGLTALTAAKYADALSSSFDRVKDALGLSSHFFDTRDSAQLLQIKTKIFGCKWAKEVRSLEKAFWAFLEYRGIHVETDPVWAGDEEARRRKFIAFIQSQGLGPDAPRSRLSAIASVSATLNSAGQLHGSLLSVDDPEKLKDLYSWWQENGNDPRKKIPIYAVAFKAYMRFCGMQTDVLDRRRRRACRGEDFQTYLSVQKGLSKSVAKNCLNILSKIADMLGDEDVFSDKDIDKVLGLRQKLLETQIQNRVQVMGALGQWKTLALYLEFLGAGEDEIKPFRPQVIERRIRLRGMPDSFALYLTDVRSVDFNTLHHYANALGRFSMELRERGTVQQDIYEVRDSDSLRKIAEHLPPYAQDAFRVYQAFLVSHNPDSTTRHVGGPLHPSTAGDKVEQFEADIRTHWPAGFDFSEGAVRLLESRCGKLPQTMKEVLKAKMFHPKGRLWFCLENLASEATRRAVVSAAKHLIGEWGLVSAGVLAKHLDVPEAKLRDEQMREEFAAFLSRQAGFRVCQLEGGIYVAAMEAANAEEMAKTLCGLVREFIDGAGGTATEEEILDEFPSLDRGSLSGLMARWEPEAIPEMDENGRLYFKLLPEYYLPANIGAVLKEGIATAEAEGTPPTAAWLATFLSARYGCDFPEDYALEPSGALKWALLAVWRQEEPSDLRWWKGEGARARFVGTTTSDGGCPMPRNLPGQVEATFPGVFSNEEFWQYAVGHYGLSDHPEAKASQLGYIAPCFVRLDRDHWMSVAAFRAETGWNEAMAEEVAKVLRKALGSAAMLPVTSLGASTVDELPDVRLDSEGVSATGRVLRWTPELIASVAALLCPGVHVANHGMAAFAVTALLVPKPVDTKDVFAYAMRLYCARNPYRRDVREAFAFLQANNIRFRFTPRARAEIEEFLSREAD